MADITGQWEVTAQRWQEESAAPPEVTDSVDPYSVMTRLGLPELGSLVEVTGKVEEKESGDMLVTFYRIEKICRPQHDVFVLRIAWYEARANKWRDQAKEHPDMALEEFIKIWKRSETIKKCKYTAEEVVKLNFGNLVKHVPMPHLVTMLDNRVMENMLKKSEDKYYLE